MKVPDTHQLEPPSRAPLQREFGSPRRILLVDDDTAIRQLSQEMLVRAGFSVDAAADGAAGWEALQAKQYDLMITDNSMPKVTGVELVKLLRGQNTTLPVIMASGTTPTDEMKRNPQLEISAILLKPFTLEDLLVTVKQVLSAPHAAAGQFESPQRRQSSLP